jgi:hypothetical protein
VNKSQKEESCDQGVEIEEDKNSTSRLSLRNGAYVTDINAKEENSVIEKSSVIKARDKQAVNIVINYKGGKKVINNNKKVFNTFNNNKNKNYKKSSEDEDAISENRGGLDVSEVNNSNNKKGPSKVNINKSNNRDYTKAGDNNREVSVVKGDKNIGGRENR